MNFQVELTSHCDLTCGYCPNKDMERKRAFMSDAVFGKILREYIVPYKDRNSFSPPTFIGHKDGEPLLNKQLPARLIALSEVAPDMHIDIYSHGLMLPKWKERTRQDFFEFLATLPNKVRYMMSYHPKNHDYSVNDYMPVVEYLKGVLRRPPRNVEFITVSHKSKWTTQAMQDAWRDTWREEIYRGVLTVHANCSINPWTGRMEDIATCHYNGCPYSDFGHWFFGATGNIIACCLDLEEEIILGNVMHNDPADMFAKTEAFYAEQRKTLEERRRVNHPVCANCYGQERSESPSLIQVGMRS